MQALWQDLRFGVRVLKKNPGFTAVAILTLAIAIGANAVVFGVLNALILRPLNLPHAESLYQLEHASDKIGSESYPNYLDLRDRNRTFDALAGFNINGATLDTNGNLSTIWLYEVTGNYFDALGVQPYLGRFIHASDERGPNSAPYIVLSYAYWHAHFQDDPRVVDRTLQLDRHSYTVIGVAPPGFRGTLLFSSPDLFVPIVNQEQIDDSSMLNQRGNRWMTPIGHLKAGVTPAQATADLNSIGADLEKNYPKDDAKLIFAVARPGLLGDLFRTPVQAFLAGLMLLAGLILLAACANLGSLFAARAADRSREVALRLALGAGRLRILRQLVFTEALLISLMGGAVGLWGSIMLLGALSTWHPIPQFPFVNIPADPDSRVYGISLLLAVASGFLSGAVPVRQVLRTDPYQIIKAGTMGQVGRRMTVRDALLAAQIAICAVLVSSSLVAVRGMLRSLHGSFGFEPRGVTVVSPDLGMAGYNAAEIPAMQKRLIDSLETIAGVTYVGLVDGPPLTLVGNSDSNIFTEETSDLRASNAAADATIFRISPEYFRAAGTALLAGRNFTWQDDKTAPHVAVVNLDLARRLFGTTTNATGRYFKTPDGARIQIVGIVEDGKYTSLTEASTPAMFLPISQSPTNATWLLVRSGGDTQQLATAIRSKLRDLDAGLPFSVTTWTRDLEPVLFPARMATISLGVLGVMGALLAVTGIFGMAAYSVSKRLRELGIRIALGAQRKEVLQAALGRAFKLLAFGSAAGLLLGILASRALAAIVYEATSRDPVVLLGAVAAMFLLGLLATWVPARRALAIDPAILLREE